METIQSTSERSKRDYLLLREALDHGNQQAYAELLRLYRNPIYYMLLKMMNDPNDAEDLTMEAFGKAFKNLHQYTPDYAFSTWLFKIASNNCIDFIRKRKREIIMTFVEGKLAVFLSKWLPGLVDRLSYSLMAKEPDSPFK